MSEPVNINPWAPMSMPDPGQQMSVGQPSLEQLMRGPAAAPEIVAPKKKKAAAIAQPDGRETPMPTNQRIIDYLRGLQAQQHGADQLKGIADKVDQTPSQVDLSPLMALADSWSGSKTSAGYNKPMTADEKAMRVASLRKLATEAQSGVTKDQLAFATTGEKSDTSYLKAILAMQAKSMGDAAKSEKGTNGEFVKLDESLDPNRWRGGEFGKLAGMVNSADRAMVLGQQFTDGNLPPAQMAELGSAVASLISGGGHSAESVINRFIPNTKGNIGASVMQFLTDEPQGANQQAFVKQLMDTANREKALAADKIKGIQFSRIASRSHLRSKDVDKFQSVLSSHGINPDEYDSYVANGFKQPDTGMPSAPGTGGLSADKQARLEELRKKRDEGKLGK